MPDLLQRLEESIQARRLLKPNQVVLVAVSGGLDSMVLLQALHALSARHPWKLTVAHFNHQLRGRSSDADEKLVCQAAAALRLPFVAGRADVRRFVEKSRLSIEMAARKLRHEFFARAARERNISVVALAHHADDQVELFFLRLLRGAGGEGLAGMKWRSASPVDGKITLIRPLLGASKAELRDFAHEHKIRFREDATNTHLDLPRNRVRHELLPLLRRRYQPALARAVLRLMEIVGAEADFATAAARQWLKETGKGKSRGRLRTPRRGGVTAFANLPVAVQRRVLQLQLMELGVAADFEPVERLRRSPGVFFSVGPSLSTARDSTGVITMQTPTPAGFNTSEFRMKLAGGGGKVNFAGVRFRWNFAGAERNGRLLKRAGREFFDADKVGDQIVLRHWRAGDRFQPIGLKSAVKLQDLFTNQKIPRAHRHNLVVAEAANGEVFWGENLRMAEHFKLTPGTKRRLAWNWRRLQAEPSLHSASR